MANFNTGDKVKITNEPENWPACSKFTLLGAEGTISLWVDWPDMMDPYGEYVYIMVDRAQSEGKLYEGTEMLFHESILTKI